jgi:hypothetical protein
MADHRGMQVTLQLDDTTPCRLEHLYEMNAFLAVQPA